MNQGVGAVTTEGISILINESGGGCLEPTEVIYRLIKSQGGGGEGVP